MNEIEAHEDYYCWCNDQEKMVYIAQLKSVSLAPAFHQMSSITFSISSIASLQDENYYNNDENENQVQQLEIPVHYERNAIADVSQWISIMNIYIYIYDMNESSHFVIDGDFDMCAIASGQWSITSLKDRLNRPVWDKRERKKRRARDEGYGMMKGEKPIHILCLE